MREKKVAEAHLCYLLGGLLPGGEGGREEGAEEREWFVLVGVVGRR
jgi:hypothetical protein